MRYVVKLNDAVVYAGDDYDAAMAAYGRAADDAEFAPMGRATILTDGKPTGMYAPKPGPSWDGRDLPLTR